MVVLTEQIEIPASYEKLKAWTANFEEEFVKWSPYHIECNLYNGNYLVSHCKDAEIIKREKPCCRVNCSRAALFFFLSSCIVNRWKIFIPLGWSKGPLFLHLF